MSYNPSVLDEAMARFLEGVADSAVSDLRERLNQGGSGKQHAHLPNRSSAPGEYPAKQFGKLLASIGSRRTGKFTYRVGALNGPPEAVALEMSPPGRGGRPYLSRTLLDPSVWEKALRAGAARV